MTAGERSLRSYLRELEAGLPDQFHRVRDKVGLSYELTAYWWLMKDRGNPALYFERVKGSSMPVVENIFGSMDRISLALGCRRESFFDEWSRRAESPLAPTIVSGGPVRERTLEGGRADLTRLPVPKHFAEDGGRYITSGIICSKDPEDGTVNLSFARLHLKGRRRLALSMHSMGHFRQSFIKAKRMRRNLPVAVFIGAHPAYYLAAASRTTGEYELVGGLLGRSCKLVRCETVGLEVPADCEVVLEGEVRYDVEEDEGPFTEFTGYLTGRSTRNLMEISAMTERGDAIYQNIIPSNSAEHILLGGVTRQAEVARRVRSRFPQVRVIRWPSWGSHFVAVIAVRNQPRGVANLAARYLMSLDYYIKILFIVDDDVDAYEDAGFLWAVATRLQPKGHLRVIGRSTGHILDPSTAGDGFTSKLAIDATVGRSWAAKVPTLPKEVLQRVSARLTEQR